MALCGLVGGLAACDRDEVTHFRVPKGAAPVDPTIPAGMAGMAGMAGDVPAPPTPAGGAALRWTLPKGWTETAGGSMRFATLVPPVQGKVDASVVVLPGPAGGELANVNRWRGQIGLEPLDEARLASSRKMVQTKAGPVAVFDFATGGGTGSRLVAGLIVTSGNSWFVKMTGDAAAVGAARDDFMNLLGSLRTDESR